MSAPAARAVPAPPLLELRGVGRRFRLGSGILGGGRTLTAVRGVDLAVAPGETLAVVGESGCGKSTLARIALGLLAPSEGEVLYEGRPAAALRRREVARLAQPVFQDPYASLNPRRTARAAVTLPLVAQGVHAAERGRRAGAMLDRVGLPRRAHDAYPGQLSGGQRQRVAIARALVAGPRLLVCDEPTSALDVSVQAQILNLLAELKSETGVAMVLISHDLAVVERAADRVAVMYLGRLVEEAPAAELFREPRHPYTRALLASRLTPDPGLGLPALDLGATPADPSDPPSGCLFHPRCPERFAPCDRREPEAIGRNGARVRCHLWTQGARTPWDDGAAASVGASS